MKILEPFASDEVVFGQDDVLLTKAEFLTLVRKTARYVDETFPDAGIVGVRGDNNIYGLALVVGVAATGRNVLPLASMMDGMANDYLIRVTKCEDFIGYGSEFDHSDPLLFLDRPEGEFASVFGGIVSSSSGSTGLPKVSLVSPFTFSAESMGETMSAVTGDLPRKAFYSPPLMASASVFLCLTGLGFKTYLTNERPSTEVISAMAQKYGITMLSARPSMLERFMAQGVGEIPGIRALLSSGAPLTEEQLAYARESMRVEHIMDAYATTEAGLIGIRDALAGGPFEILPGVAIVSSEGDNFTVRSSFIMGLYDGEGGLEYGADRVIDDIVEHDGNAITPVGRKVKKVRVSGFSVPLELVNRAAGSIDGVLDFKITVASTGKASAAIKMRYTGTQEDPEVVRARLNELLPFAYAPKVVEFVSMDEWGAARC